MKIAPKAGLVSARREGEMPVSQTPPVKIGEHARNWRAGPWRILVRCNGAARALVERSLDRSKVSARTSAKGDRRRSSVLYVTD